MLGAACVGGSQRSNPDPVEAGVGKVLGWRRPTQAFSWQWKLITGTQWMLGATYVGGSQRSNPDPVEAGIGKVLGWWKPTQAFSWQWKLITGAQWMLGAAYVGGSQRSRLNFLNRPSSNSTATGC